MYGYERKEYWIRNENLILYVIGDMWGQSWSNILDVTIPYPGKNFLDVTQEMINQASTVVKLHPSNRTLDGDEGVHNLLFY